MKHDLERDEWLRERVNEDLKAMVEKQERQLEMSEELQEIDIPMERLEDIYRKIRAEKRTAQSCRVHRRMLLILAAALGLCMGGGLISVGSRVYEPEISQRGDKDEPTTKVNNTEAVPSEYDEEEVCQEIEEKLGVIPVRLSYQPAGMSLSEYRIEEKANEAVIKFELDEERLYIYISKDNSDSSVNWQTDGKKRDTLIVQSYNLEVSVFEYKDSQSDTYYETSFKYLNTYYSISALMDYDEYKRVIENISLKNI